MGVDAIICFKSSKQEPELEWRLGDEFKINYVGHSIWEPEATHDVDTFSRYYGPGYERGDWGEICRVLMLLLACPDIERVWYSGDTGSHSSPCTVETVLEISRHFMKYGCRPYHNYSVNKC